MDDQTAGAGLTEGVRGWEGRHPLGERGTGGGEGSVDRNDLKGGKKRTNAREKENRKNGFYGARHR